MMKEWISKALLKKKLVLGHRGYMARYPENSILSFLGAIMHGADGIELDVWLTGDKKVAVIHDRSLKRTAGLDIDVKLATIRDIRCSDLGFGQRVPYLEEVLMVIPREAFINIEIKDPDAVERTLNIIENLDRRNVLISSFNFGILQRIRNLGYSDFPIALLVSDNNIYKILSMHEELNFWSVNIPLDGINILGDKEFLNVLNLINKHIQHIMFWALDDSLFYNLKYLSLIVDIATGFIVNDVEKMLNCLRKLGVR